MLYCKYLFEKNRKTCLSIIKDDASIFNIYIEERFNKCKGYSGFPYHCFDILSKKIDRNIVVYSTNQDLYYRIKTFFDKALIVNTQVIDKYLLKGYESFYTSGFNRAAILVINGIKDSINDKEGIVLIHKFKKETKVLKVFDFEFSLNKYYIDAMTALGFNIDEEDCFIDYAIKGKPDDNRYFYVTNDGLICNCDLNNWNNVLNYLKHTINIIDKYNFAATIQRDLNESILYYVKYIKRMTGEDKLCLSGSMFNNSLINNYICESNIFNQYHCFQSPGEFYDTIGYLFYMYEKESHDYQNIKFNLNFSGNNYLDDDIVKFLNYYNIDYKIISLNEIVNLINDNSVIWFNGVSGISDFPCVNRCILFNPKKIKNTFLKENFFDTKKYSLIMPDELFDIYFDIKNKDLTEYRLRLIQVKKEKKDTIDNDIFFDGYCRPIRIYPTDDNILYNIIMRFYNIYGIPYLIGAPINDEKSSVIELLTQCMEFFEKNSYVEYLLFNGKYLINKKMLNKIKYNEYFEYIRS